MKQVILTTIILVTGLQYMFAQSYPVVVRATSKNIKILDGNDLLEGVLVPELKPDIYVYHRSYKSKKIVYYTDIDSASFDVRPGDTFDFVILLNNLDSCYQRISYQNPNKVEYSKPYNKAASIPDTIPFVLGPNNAIHIDGRINNSDILDLIFDTGASVGVLSDEGRDKNATLNNNNKNKFEFSDIVIENSPAIFVDYNGSLKADGVIGYNAFEDKIVEINYDKSIMVIHDSIRNVSPPYSENDMKWRGSTLYIECALIIGNKKFQELLIFDTGSKWALSMKKEFATKNQLYDVMPRVGTRRAKGVDGKTIKSNTYTLPHLQIGKHSLKNVPIDLELPSGAAGLNTNILGNDVLKRFNIILDYKQGRIYLQPNSLIHAEYNKSIDGDVVLVGIATLVGLSIIGLLIYKKRKSKMT